MSISTRDAKKIREDIANLKFIFEAERKESEARAQRNFYFGIGDKIASRLVGDDEGNQTFKAMATAFIMVGVGYYTNDPNMIRNGIMIATEVGLSFFDKNNNQAQVSIYQNLMKTLREIANLIEEGFNKLFEKMDFLSYQMKHLEMKVEQVKSLMSITSNEIYLEEYVSLTCSLTKFLKNAGVDQAQTGVISDLTRLQSWCSPKGLAYADTVNGTALVRLQYDPADHMRIMSSADFDCYNMLGYMTALLGRFVPHRLTDKMKIKLPNYRIFSDAVILYKRIIDKHHPKGNYAPEFTEIAEQYKAIADYFSSLLTNYDLWDSLIAQVNYYARQANQYLAYLEKQNKFSKYDGTISEVLQEGFERNHLMNCLNELEARRLLMGRFSQILGEPPELLAKIKALPVKSNFLARTRASLRTANEKLDAAGKTMDVEAVRTALNEGADYNRIIHMPSCLPWLSDKEHFSKRKNSTQIFDMLLKHVSSLNPLEIEVFRYQNWPGTGFTNIAMCPINTMIGYGAFEQLILAIAQSEGNFEISETSKRPKPNMVMANAGAGGSVYKKGVPDFSLQYNDWLRSQQGASNSQYPILRAILADINDPKGVLNKEDLRNGYQFYRAVQDDNHSKIDEMLQKSVKPHVVVWLTAILGDAKPLKELQKRKVKIEISKCKRQIWYEVSHGRFSYEPDQLATLLGQSDEVIGLIGTCIGKRYVSGAAWIEPVSAKRLVEFSLEQKFFDTAYRLWVHGYAQEESDMQCINAGREVPPLPITFSEEKTSLGLYCSAMSTCFTNASKKAEKRVQLETKSSPELMDMISKKKFAEASVYIVQTLLPAGMSEERAFAYLKVFSRHDFTNVIVALIDPQDNTIKDWLIKNIPIVIKTFSVQSADLDVIEISSNLSTQLQRARALESKLNPAETKNNESKQNTVNQQPQEANDVTEQTVVDLIKKSFEQSLRNALPTHISINMEAKAWEVLALDIETLDRSTQKKLYQELTAKYSNSEKSVSAFGDLMMKLKKLLESFTECNVTKLAETRHNFHTASSNFPFFQRSGSGQNAEAKQELVAANSI